jgi:hypothetical protein
MSGTGPERTTSMRETCGDPAAAGSVVPLELLESGTGPERPTWMRETCGDPAATGSVVPLEFLESRDRRLGWMGRDRRLG